jgi:hypothetical protein
VQFFFKGFGQSSNFREYNFESMADDRTRKQYTVAADMGLLAKHHIRIQEVPLMCIRLLEVWTSGPEAGERLVLSEEHMLTHTRTKLAAAEAAAASHKRKRPAIAPSQLGQAWRPKPLV